MSERVLQCVVCGVDFVWSSPRGHKKLTCGESCKAVHKAAIARLRYNSDLELTRERERARKRRAKEANPERARLLARKRGLANYYKHHDQNLERGRKYREEHRAEMRAREREAYIRRRELILARKRLWDAANPEKRAEYKLRYRELNLERARRKDREAKQRQRDANPELDREYARSWRAKNPDRVVEYQRRFYAQMRAALRWWRANVGHASADEGPRIWSTVRRMEEGNDNDHESRSGRSAPKLEVGQSSRDFASHS